MTSTGTYQGLLDGRNSSKVLKPPGGGSSDIFGAGGTEMVDSPRRQKQNHNASSLGSALFGNGDISPTNGVSEASTPVNITNKPGGNPVTGAGYGVADQLSSSPPANGSVTGSTGSAGSEKSSTDSSPSVNSVNRMRNRVPPGGFSSGLW